MRVTPVSLNSYKSNSVQNSKQNNQMTFEGNFVSLTPKKMIPAAMFAAMVGLGTVASSTMLTSCKNNPDITVNTDKPIQTTVQDNITSILTALNLPVTPATATATTPKAKFLGLVSLGFNAEGDGSSANENFKVNEKLSTKDQMVFDGTAQSADMGNLVLRYTVTPIAGGVHIDKKGAVGKTIDNVKDADWNNADATELIVSGGKVKWYEVVGSEKEYAGNLVANKDGSVSLVYPDGGIDHTDSNIKAVVQK